MNSNTILSSDVLDILFEKRNKNYGAYVLRKFYPDRVKTSLLIMLGFSVAFSAFTLLPKGHKPEGPVWEDGDILTTIPVDMPKEIEKPKEQPRQQSPQGPQQQYTTHYEVVKDKQRSTIFNDLKDLQISTYSDTASVPPGVEGPGIDDGTPVATAAPEPPAAPDINIPISDPDVPPAYPGGEKELRRFLERNLQAPEDIADMVQVKIKFVVDNDGKLESFTILQDGGEAFNEEVIRVLKKMPQWNPGKKGGRNVKAYCYLPVKFAPTE